MIKESLRKILSPELKCILSNIYYSIIRIIHFKKKIITSHDYSIIEEPQQDCFFGYYDISPYNNHLLIYLVLNESKTQANVILKNLKTLEKKVLATTNAWNWQQGARLRWLPGTTDKIIFNDYAGGQYCSRIICITNGQEKIINYPLYDIDCLGEKALTLSFDRLGIKRPGYGYTNKTYQEDKHSLNDEGVYEVNLINNDQHKLFTYIDVINTIGCQVPDLCNCYINHISYSPSCNKFLFFFINIVDNYHLAYLVVYDFESQQLTPLETQHKVSHYVWVDDNRILCTVYDEHKKCSYIMYTLNGEKNKVFTELDFDGHPTMVDRDTFITDSYPDANSYQHLYICKISSETVRSIFDIYAASSATVERRTDLHPRFDKTNSQVCIDCNMDGKRKICLINI